MDDMYKVKSEEYRGCTINIYQDPDPESPRTWDNVATFVCKYERYQLGDRQDIDRVIEELFYEHVTSKAIIDYFVKGKRAELVEGEEGDQCDHYYKYKGTWYDGSTHDYFINADSEDDDEDSIACQMAETFGDGDKLALIEMSGDIVMLPISVYEHSGITMWLGSKSNHFDSDWDCSNVGFAYIEKSTAEKEGMLDPGEKYDHNWKKWAYEMMDSEMETYRQYLEGEVYGYMTEDEDGIEGGNNWFVGCWGYFGRDEIDSVIIPEAKSEIDGYLKEKEETRKSNIANLSTNLANLGDKFYVIGEHVYCIAPDIFEQPYLMRADIKKNVITEYYDIKINDLDDDTLAELNEKVNQYECTEA